MNNFKPPALPEVSDSGGVSAWCKSSGWSKCFAEIIVH